jgi:hypothetical protein
MRIFFHAQQLQHDLPKRISNKMKTVSWLQLKPAKILSSFQE